MIAGLLTLGLAGLAVDTIIAVLGRRLLHYAGR
jgi:ABC-type nitrate/sulfonate/bicarbonate transport system permease component